MKAISKRAFGSPIDKEGMNHTLEEPFEQLLTNVHWINFWHKKDKVSGPLDFYTVDENREIQDGMWTLTEAHNKYWGYGEMYREIIERYF